MPDEIPQGSRQDAPDSVPRSKSLVRKPLLVMLGLVVALYLWAGPLPMGHGPAGPPVNRAAFQATWRTGKVLLVGMGDSITTGFGAGGRKYGYFARLISNPPNEWPQMRGICLRAVFPKLQVCNYATNASNCEEHLTLQLPQLPRQAPDVFGIIVLTTGGIDLIHTYGKYPPTDGAIYGASYEQAVKFGRLFRQRLEQLLDGIKARFPGGCAIFLANIYDPTDGVGDIENVNPLLRLIKKLPPWPDGLKALALYNRHLAKAAQARDFVHLVDIKTPLMGHGIHCRDSHNPYYHPEDPHFWYFFNLEDPNQRGYDAIRRVFLRKMAAVFAPASREHTAPPDSQKK